MPTASPCFAGSCLRVVVSVRFRPRNVMTRSEHLTMIAKPQQSGDGMPE